MHANKILKEETSSTPALSEAEAHKILVEFNRTAADYRRDVCVHQLFEEQVEATPNATALVCDEQRLTYAELNSRANRLAHYLRKRGAGPEVLVGICVERSPEMLVGILGILKAGAAYVPLDPAYPRERLAVILEDARAPLLVTQQSVLAALPRYSGQAIGLDSDWPAIATEPAGNPASEVKPENLSYVLFTSGSTGRPKGVAIEHRSSAGFIQWAQSVFTPREVEGTLFSTSMCFDLSIFEMFVPLSMGGKVIVVQNALSFPRSRAANEVTLVNTVPSAIAELVRADAVPGSVLLVNLAGEALLSSLVQRIYDKTTVRKVYNLYGPTEYTTYATYALVPRDREVTIGRPLANTQVYILDESRRPVPMGAPGELYLAGDGLARGYFGRDDLTAERFVFSPFGAEPNSRMYRTGDLACFLPDGNIRYLGRLDNQVKIRGFRIELGEIESRLVEHPAVQSAVVIAREDQPGDRRLVAYLVPAVGQELDSRELSAFLRISLPEYMVPATFVGVDSLPLTPNGKIDRRALPVPRPQFSDNPAGVARDELESVLLAKWREALGISAIGVTDNFFDLGGHSLTAARLLFEIEKVIGREIPLNVLLRGATVESLARLIREGSEAIPDPVLMTIRPARGAVPFFGVVPPGEESLGFALLARHMENDHPVYKLQGREPVIAGKRPAFTQEELRALSREYIGAMRSAQPDGPYCIGAMCDGVQIAERIVLDLEAQGDEVGFFAIFDTWVLQNVQRPWLWRLAYYEERFQELRDVGFGAQLRAYTRALRNNLSRVASTGQPGFKKGIEQAYWPEDFVAGRFHAPVALFKKPKQPYFYVKDPQMGWGARCTSRVEIHEVDFDHEEMLREPFVRDVAAVLVANLRHISQLRQEKRPSNRVLLVSALSENI